MNVKTDQLPAMNNKIEVIKHCYVINLQSGVGGGEIYSQFFISNLLYLGWKVTLFAKTGSWLLQCLDHSLLEAVAVRQYEDIPRYIKDDKDPVFVHTPFGGAPAEAIKQQHQLVFFAHMPVKDRNPALYFGTQMVVGVSSYVINTLRDAGIKHVWPNPLYGIANLAPRGVTGKQIVRNSVYDWDKRKVRERIMSWFAPLLAPFKRTVIYKKRPGITLAIVSRITPIKQFPLLFEHLVPILEDFPEVNLEIFGSGGFRSVSDLKQVLRPLGDRVRFWGNQNDVALVYKQVDYVLSGLPEKEALGLNLLEAQACDVPVLAVNAAPFTETVLHGVTGWLYTDPREDEGQSFAKILHQLQAGLKLDGSQADAHLKKFSETAFRDRLGQLMMDVYESGTHRVQ